MSAPGFDQSNFLDPGNVLLVRKVGAFLDELRAFEGERVAEAEEAVAAMAVQDPTEGDRRLRRELIRTVATSRPPEHPATLDPEELRRILFRIARERGHAGGSAVHDLFSVDRDTIINAAAAALGASPGEVDKLMFADTPGERLLEFPAGEPDQVANAAIRTVNLDRLRRGLRHAVRLTLSVPARTSGGISYVQLLWGAKRLDLMCEAREEDGRIILEISGPYSLFDKTTMYGNRLFEFTRVILDHAGREWALSIEVIERTGKRPGTLHAVRLDSSIRHFFRSEGEETRAAVRSRDEEAFQKYFARVESDWRLEYEGELILLGDPGRKQVIVPDFVARCSRTPAEILIEIVGFWRREYLEKKIEKVRSMGDRRIILIVNSRLSVAREDFRVPGRDNVKVFFYSGREELKLLAPDVVKELDVMAEKSE